MVDNKVDANIMSLNTLVSMRFSVQDVKRTLVHLIGFEGNVTRVIRSIQLPISTYL